MQDLTPWFLSIPLLFAISACAGDRIAAMERFKNQQDKNVAQQKHISGYLSPTSGVALAGVKEVRPGIVEYSFEPRYAWSEEVKCKYIFVVAKDTGTIIGWRYNGKPENCQQAR